jgi:4-carboxymuconolactone decarboxylase
VRRLMTINFTTDMSSRPTESSRSRTVACACSNVATGAGSSMRRLWLSTRSAVRTPTSVSGVIAPASCGPAAVTGGISRMPVRDVRIPVPRAEELRADVSELLPLIAPPGREPARTMAVLARPPDLLSPFLGWAAALALNAVLPHRDHELLALRFASNCRSEFEWVEHVEYARAAALTDDEIAMVSEAIGDGVWSDAERALLSAADELHRDSDVSDGTWAVLAEHYDPPALVEFLFVVGQYTMLSLVANAAGIPAGPSVLSSSVPVSAASRMFVPCARPASRCTRWSAATPTRRLLAPSASRSRTVHQPGRCIGDTGRRRGDDRDASAYARAARCRRGSGGEARAMREAVRTRRGRGAHLARRRRERGRGASDRYRAPIYSGPGAARARRA